VRKIGERTVCHNLRSVEGVERPTATVDFSWARLSDAGSKDSQRRAARHCRWRRCDGESSARQGRADTHYHFDQLHGQRHSTLPTAYLFGRMPQSQNELLKATRRCKARRQSRDGWGLLRSASKTPKSDTERQHSQSESRPSPNSFRLPTPAVGVAQPSARSRQASDIYRSRRLTAVLESYPGHSGDGTSSSAFGPERQSTRRPALQRLFIPFASTRRPRFRSGGHLEKIRPRSIRTRSSSRANGQILRPGGHRLNS